jgi:hypothetical protein
MTAPEWHEKCPRCNSTDLEVIDPNAKESVRDAGRDGDFHATRRCRSCGELSKPEPPASFVLERMTPVVEFLIALPISLAILAPYVAAFVVIFTRGALP